MAKINYFKNDKRKLYRVVITAYLPHEAGGHNHKKTADKIHSLNNSIREALNNSVHDINMKIGNFVRNVNVDFFMKDGDIKEPDIYTSGVTEKYVRIIIDLIGLNGTYNDFLLQKNISHLVNIKIGKDNKGWSYPGELGVATVSVSEQNVQHLIHDIILDITMFNSYPVLAMQFNKTDEQRKKFNKIKHEFIVSSNLKDYYGEIPRSTAGYCCFASLCRAGNTFDINKYITIWNEFTSNIIIDMEPVINKKCDELICNILSSNKRNGQISLSKFKKAVSVLPNGSYLLIMTDHRPSRSTDRSKIASLFGRSCWKQNLWTIKDVCHFSDYSRYSPFITFYKFSWE